MPTESLGGLVQITAEILPFDLEGLPSFGKTDIEV